MIFLTPWLFGLGASLPSKHRSALMCLLLYFTAHAHHGWEIFNRYGRTAAAVRRALLATGTFLDSSRATSIDRAAAVFQTLYTSLFGFHCAYLFLRTGSLLAPLTAHIFCNIMGFPQYGEQIIRFPRHRRGQFCRQYRCTRLTLDIRRNQGCISARDRWIYIHSGCVDAG